MPRIETPSPAPHAASDVESSGPPSELDVAGCAPKPQKRKRQPKLPPLIVSSDRERVDIMEWVQLHPILYDKACDEYSNKEAKKQLYQEKARELGVEGSGDEPGQRLLTKTQRDKVGRLMKIAKGVSGSGAPKLTAENQRFLRRFGWLHQYRNVKNVGTPIVAGLHHTLHTSAGSGESEQQRHEADVDEDVEEMGDIDVDDSGPTLPSTSASSRPCGSRGRPSKKGCNTSSPEFDKLSRELSSTRATITQCLTVEKGFESQRMFAELIFHETIKMDPEIWSAYYVAATQQLHQFINLQIHKNQQRQQRHQQFHPPPQHFQPPHPQHYQPSYPQHYPASHPQHFQPSHLQHFLPSQPQHFQPSPQTPQAPPQTPQAPPQPLQAPPQTPQAPPQPLQAPPQPLQAPQQPPQAPPHPHQAPPQPPHAPQPPQTSQLIWQSYDPFSPFYSLQAPDSLINVSTSDLNLSALLAGPTGLSTSTPKTPNVEKNGNRNGYMTDGESDLE